MYKDSIPLVVECQRRFAIAVAALQPAQTGDKRPVTADAPGGGRTIPICRLVDP